MQTDKLYSWNGNVTLAYYNLGLSQDSDSVHDKQHEVECNRYIFRRVNIVHLYFLSS